ncbi:MAG TPA: CBS domain-containing protein [Polyangia bacterium]|jgi:CBS domain-containing protein|nr:CBS domain-containing protein [Polyangia bacterium]
MNLDPEWISSSASVLDAARTMRDRSMNYLLIFEPKPGPGPGDLRGIVTERDLAVRVCAENKVPATTPVMDIATAEVITCSADEDLRSAEATMRGLEKSRLVVVDENGKVVGLLALADILREDRQGPAVKTALGVLGNDTRGHQTPPDRIKLTPSTSEDEDAALRQPSAMMGAARINDMKVFPGT